MWLAGRPRGRGNGLVGSVLGALLGVGLVTSGPGQAVAQETPGWESLGPKEAISRLTMPANGGLYATRAAGLLRGADGGAAFEPVKQPAETTVIRVSPVNRDVLFAAGSGGVFKSEDGGASWQRTSDRAGTWQHLEISPADPSHLYGVIQTAPVDAIGMTRTYEYVASEDGGATWMVRATHKDESPPGILPCFYETQMLRPLSASPQHVVTITGCTGRASNPQVRLSHDGLRSGAVAGDDSFGLGSSWGVWAVAGGERANPTRWYLSIFGRDRLNTDQWRQELLRSDDNGAGWMPLQRLDLGGPRSGSAKPFEEVTKLALNPSRPDEVYAGFTVTEPVEDEGLIKYTSRHIVRVSQDGGSSWTDLPQLPQVNDLAVSQDGQHLYAATTSGVYRVPVPR